MLRWHLIWKDIYSPLFALMGSINDQGHTKGLLISYICIFMTILVHTCFSHQPKTRGWEAHLEDVCGVLITVHVCYMLHLSIHCLSHHRPIWSSLPFP